MNRNQLKVNITQKLIPFSHPKSFINVILLVSRKKEQLAFKNLAVTISFNTSFSCSNIKWTSKSYLSIHICILYIHVCTCQWYITNDSFFQQSKLESLNMYTYKADKSFMKHLAHYFNLYNIFATTIRRVMQHLYVIN